MDSSIWIFVCFRVNVSFGAWKFNCNDVRKQNSDEGMHTEQLSRTVIFTEAEGISFMKPNTCKKQDNVQAQHDNQYVYTCILNKIRRKES